MKKRSAFRITVANARAARAAFETNEPRDLFYRAATELVALARRGATSLTLAEALAVLLQTWNMAYYRYRPFDARHFADIEALLKARRKVLDRFRDMAIKDMSDGERDRVSELFEAFEEVLGPVGAAKSLHLLAPALFPIWDRTIAAEYRLALGRRGSNGDRYWRFMLIARGQCRGLKGWRGNRLKVIDEYNYGRYTQEWI